MEPVRRALPVAIQPPDWNAEMVSDSTAMTGAALPGGRGDTAVRHAFPDARRWLQLALAAIWLLPRDSRQLALPALSNHETPRVSCSAESPE